MTALLAAAAAAMSVALLRARPDHRHRVRSVSHGAGDPDRSGPADSRRTSRGALLMASVGVVTLVVLLASAVSPVLCLAGCSAVLVALRQTIRARGRRVAALRQSATVDAVFALAAELRAGQPPARALALVAGHGSVLADPLAAASAAVAAGASAEDELRRLARLPGCAGLRGVAAAWEVTSAVGGGVADVLDRLGDVLDSEQQAAATLAAALAGPRATMLLLAGLPLVGLALGQALGARPLHLLLHRPLGWALLAGAVVLDVIGMVWTSAIISRAMR